MICSSVSEAVLLEDSVEENLSISIFFCYKCCWYFLISWKNNTRTNIYFYLTAYVKMVQLYFNIFGFCLVPITILSVTGGKYIVNVWLLYETQEQQ